MDFQHTALQAPLNFLGAELLSAPQFQIDLNRPYLVKGLLLSGQVSMLVGPPNLGKSSIVACLAAHLAMGKPLGDLRVKKTAGLYIGAEDPTGIAERAFACWEANAANDAYFYIHQQSVNLMEKARMRNFIKAANDFQTQVCADRMLIVFDTLNLCIGDGDENSSRDMSLVVGNVQDLARETGAHVMLIHHTGAADPGKPRGSTAMLSNVDTMLVLRRAEGFEDRNLVALTQMKQRSVRKGDPLLFEIEAFFVGHDCDGERMTVPIARSVPATGAVVSERPARPQRSETDLRAMEVMRVLNTFEAENPGTFVEARHLLGFVGKGFEGVGNNPDSLRKAVRRALDLLIEKKAVETDSQGLVRAVSARSSPSFATH